jgi:ABC-type amino acid transport system permease subunit
MATILGVVINFVRKNFTFTIVSVYVEVFRNIILSLNMDFDYLQLNQSIKLKPPFGVKSELIIQEHWCFISNYY